MDWQDDETKHPWEQGGDLPWDASDDGAGWTPPDPESWRSDELQAELPSWPEFAAGTETWHKETDDEE